MMNIGRVIIIVVSCLVQLQEIDAIEYSVTNTLPNTPGGEVFDEYVGVEYCLQILPSIADIVFNILQEETAADRCNVTAIYVYVTEFDGYAFESGNQINISASTLDRAYYPRENSKQLFFSVMIHEMTHVLQWDGGYTAPESLLEGIADYVRIKAGYYDPGTKPGEGDKWDQGYGVTARFLEYCDSLLDAFTAKLNKMMRYKYDDAYWINLLGKPVDQLWRDYKAKYQQPA